MRCALWKTCRSCWLGSHLVLNLAGLAALSVLVRLTIDRVLILAACKHGLAHSDCVHIHVQVRTLPVGGGRPIVLVVRVQHHVILHGHLLRHDVRVILLPVVRCELVLVLQKRVLLLVLVAELVGTGNVALTARSS
jgi:hypothetical protein